MTKKVTFVVNEFPVLSETFVIEQVCALIDLGLEVNIIANKKSPDADVIPKFKLYDLDKKLICLSSFPRGKSRKFAMIFTILKNFHSLKNKASFLKELLLCIKNLNFSVLEQLAVCANVAKDKIETDFVICHFLPNGHLAYALRKFSALQCNTIATIAHGYDLSLYKILKKWDGAYKRFISETELLLPISQRWADLLIKDYNADPKKVFVQHMGVNVKNINFYPREINIDNGPVKFIAVGRATEKKGLEYAIKAIAQTKNTELSIVGDGELLKQLELLIDDLGARGQVKMLGRQPHEQVLSLLENSHVFILPSVRASDGDMEGIPVALMEAMASGLLVISTNHSGIPELIDHKVSGLLADEKSVSQLKQNIEYIVENRRDTHVLIMKARVKIQEQFDNEKLSRQLMGLIVKR